MDVIEVSNLSSLVDRMNSGTAAMTNRRSKIGSKSDVELDPNGVCDVRLST